MASDPSYEALGVESDVERRCDDPGLTREWSERGEKKRQKGRTRDADPSMLLVDIMRQITRTIWEL